MEIWNVISIIFEKGEVVGYEKLYLDEAMLRKNK